MLKINFSSKIPYHKRNCFILNINVEYPPPKNLSRLYKKYLTR